MAGQFEPKSEVSEEASILEMNTIDETVVDNIVNNIETSTFAESSKTDTGSAGVQPVRDGLVADGNVNLLKGA